MACPSQQGSNHSSLEERLLSRLAQGDKTVFWRLWDPYQTYLYRCCLKWMGGNPTDAEDACSRAMLKAWEKLPIYAHKLTNLKAWLARLTHNLCIDLIRCNQRGAQGLEQVDTLTANDQELDQAVNVSPENQMLRHELGSAIQEALDTLPSQFREPFTLRYVHHLSYREIAERLALTEATLYKRVQQAKGKLKKQLSPYVSGDVSPVLPGFSDNSLDTSLAPMNLPLTPETESINYQVTVLCLETLSCNWFPLCSPLGWF